MYQAPTGLQPLPTHGPSTSSSNPFALSHPSAASIPDPVASSSRRKPKAPTKAKAEWERIKPRLKQLYIDENKSLEEVIQILERDENFRATTTQFTTKINNWKFKKTVRKEEYQHLLRKEEEARNSTNPSKRKRYTIRDLPIKRAKIKRFMIDHPNLKPRRSPTPSDIASETERFSDVTGAMSQLCLGEQDDQNESLSDHASGSFDSEVALTVYAPKDPAQKAWNSFVNFDVISQDLGGQSDSNQDDNVLDVEAEAANLVAEAPRNKPHTRSPMWERGRIVPLSQRQRRPAPQSSETHDPGAYCPAVSKFHWWRTYTVSSEINSRLLSSTIDSRPLSPTNNSRPLYAANDNDLPFYRFREKAFEENLSKDNSWIADAFRGLIYTRDTYADEMAHREKAHQHLMLAIEAGITPVETGRPLPNYYQITELPWMILLKRDEIIAKISIDIPWCISEILRTTVYEFMYRFSFKKLFLRLRALTELVSDSVKQKIFDAFHIFLPARVFGIYNPNLLQHSDNHGVLPPRIRNKVVEMGAALMWYFDPIRPRAYVARPELTRDLVPRSAFLGLKITSLPITAYRLITGLRYVQGYRNRRYAFKGDQDPIAAVAKELDQPSSAHRELEWFDLWTVLSPPHVPCPDHEDMRKVVETFIWLWVDLDRSLRAFTETEELMDFLHGRIEQGPATPLAHNTDDRSRVSVDDKSEASADDKPEASADGKPEASADDKPEASADDKSGGSANKKSWPPAYKAFEAWVNQEVRSATVQRCKAVTDGSVSEIVGLLVALSFSPGEEDLAEQALEDWTKQAQEGFLALAVNADLGGMRKSSTENPSDKTSISRDNDSPEASTNGGSAATGKPLGAWVEPELGDLADGSEQAGSHDQIQDEEFEDNEADTVSFWTYLLD
ncbi:MAG: hypothetical protein M1822_005705 [Bathelium mastoideum]|nr:MAG: hypothetical protein M1822_005705 [Bathelium mastoideum]